jgi:hypothetical protein
MSVLNQLASSLDRRDEVPNQRLAQRIVDQRDGKAIRELAEQLSTGKKAVRSDCIKVLSEIGERDPELIADYCELFAALIDGKDNRLAWGAMTALDYIATVRPNDVYRRLDAIVEAADHGSVITRDHAVGILIKLAAHKSHATKSIAMLLQILKDAPGNQIPMYAENACDVIGLRDRQAFRKILERRMDGLTRESQKQRVAKVLRKLETKGA